jgi:plastocyanin
MTAMETTKSNRARAAQLTVAIATSVAIFGAALFIPAASFSGPVGDTELRSLTLAQKRAKARAMAKCKQIKPKAKRNACIKQVNKRFAPSGPAIGKTWEVDVWDNYYAPGILDVTVNDAIEWVWKEDSREGHNVSLLEGPRGVSPYDFESRVIYDDGSKFKRQIKVAGTYTFFCSLHAGMQMQVNARK